jgi:hypothetical protein
MPRLSLYRPEKGHDYKFIDKTIWEMFQVGGTDVLIHKYLGPRSFDIWNDNNTYAAGDLVTVGQKLYKSKVDDNQDPVTNTDSWQFVREGTPSQPLYNTDDPFQIEDLLFLENRNRKYSDDVYILRGVYNIQDTDFNLSQFGLFLQNDTIFVTFHINDTVEKIGRKLISGDVIELPHLKDDFALNDLQFAIKRFYVIEEVTRAAEGFSVTWYPHLYRAKCKPLVDSQEFKDILDKKIVDCEGNVTDMSLGQIVSTYEKEMQITQAILDQAEDDVLRSGFDTTKYYTLQKDSETGRLQITTADNTHIDASEQQQATDIAGNLLFDDNGDPVYLEPTASTVFANPDHKDYRSYINGDGIPPNGAAFIAGIAFPTSPLQGQYCLRTDFLPNRLFQYNGKRWVKIEDDVRMTMSNQGSHDTTVNRGVWNVDTSYNKGDLVRFNGFDYVSKTDTNLGNIPIVDKTSWQAIRMTQKTSFINNSDVICEIDGHEIKQRQSLSKALRPQADE